jgi:cystathionine gamma-synthase
MKANPKMVDALIETPLCKAQDLGKAIPASEHANSVCLPRWADNVGYEEGDPEVVDRLEAGYPRFVYHPRVVKLFEACEKKFAGKKEFCQAYPSQNAARRCVDYVRGKLGIEGAVHAFSAHAGDIHAVCFPNQARDFSKKYWQHTGEGVSSRHAAAVIEGRTATSASDTKARIRERIAKKNGVEAESVYLFSSGMAAIYTVQRTMNRVWPKRQTVQFGFPYVDMLKVQEEFGIRGVRFFPRGDGDDLDDLVTHLDGSSVSGLFFEFPANPLLTCPDVDRLVALSSRYDFLLIADDTIGTSVNVALLPTVDVLTTSLTKFFVGAGDVMGGAVVLNADGRHQAEFRRGFDLEYEDLLFADDAVLIERYSNSYEPRVRSINETAERLCEYLQGRPEVEHIYYPKSTTRENYDKFRRSAAGYGGLFSMTLKDQAVQAPRFFDALEISKGPNLGTSFSLCCPYTILAHYDELEEVENIGVSRYLLRVSVGLEPYEELVRRFDAAFETLDQGAKKLGVGGDTARRC